MNFLPILPINLEDLINVRTVESARIEFKKTWNEPIKDAVFRTICAFANDFENLNGGYIILGIDETKGHPILPPYGLDGFDLEKIQKEIFGKCNRINPEYIPIVAPRIYQDKPIIIIWVQAGELRPYQVPEKITSKTHKERAYYVRIGAETKKAKGDLLTELMQSTKRIPFDDRRNLVNAPLEAISPTLVREFLYNINSDLISPEVNISDIDLYHSLRITAKTNGYEIPKNIALLFFNNNPDKFF